MSVNQQNQPSNDNNSRDAGDNRPSCVAPLQRAGLFHSPQTCQGLKPPANSESRLKPTERLFDSWILTTFAIVSHSHSISSSALQKALLLTGCLLMACQSPAGAESWNLSDVATPQLLAQVPRQYLVYVKGESNEMLEQVRRVAPDAYIDQYKGRRVIKAGTFYDRELAKRREREIEALYIRAEVARIEGRYNPRTAGYSPYSSSRIEGRANPSTGYSTRPSTSRRIIDNDYFVVIPASAQDLTAIAEQVRLLGAPAEGVEDRDKPRGYHVLVGPFADRNIAERWNRYLKDLGLGNSRVYYGR